MNKKVLITGYTGFVGKNLVDLLVEMNCELFFLGRRPSSLGKFFLYDFSASNDYRDILKDIDVVVHCAAITPSSDNLKKFSAEDFYSFNFIRTVEFAKQCSDCGVKKFIFISTAKVNGDSTSNREAFSILDDLNPQDIYSESKAKAELGIIEATKSCSMSYVIIRPPLVYGEGVKASLGLLFKIVSLPIPLPFSLIKSNKKSLVSVYNLVDLIAECINNKNAVDSVFYVSDDVDLSLVDILSLVSKSSQKKLYLFPAPIFFFKILGVLFNKRKKIDSLIGSLHVDISHTKSKLDWQPPHSLEDCFTLISQ